MERTPLPEGELILLRNWLAPDLAEHYFERLRHTVQWEQSTIVIAGRPQRIPRLNAWYGDPGMDYRYSGKSFTALPWTPDLQAIRERVQRSMDELSPGSEPFNSVLLNLYRDGSDSVGWHSDNERELGSRPQIASVSLGAGRRFVLKHRREKEQRVELALEAGSLLLMLGDLQKHWLHALPKTRKPVGPRINLTFRRIVGFDQALSRKMR